MRFGSLFAGIGGFDLGLERAGMECAWQVEIDDYATKVLEKHWPNVKRFRDIRECGAANLEAVDLICGGFPCQPFSHASRGRIVAEDLWPEMFRVIQGLKPRLVIAENVQRKPISNAARQLEEIGYRVTIRNIKSSSIGADHQRSRWWVIAHPYDNGKLYSRLHAEASKLQKIRSSIWEASDYSRVLRVPDGIPSRVDRLKCLGNAVIPQIVETIGRAIMTAHKEADE